MRKYVLIILAAISIISFNGRRSLAEMNFDPKLKMSSGRNYSSEIKSRDYNRALDKQKKIAGSVLGLSVDFMLGYNSTSANADDASDKQQVTTTSKGGFSFGAMLNINVLGLGFSTGLDFTKKNFGIEIPYYDSTTTVDSVSSELTNSYMNIPLNINYGGMISDDIGLTFSGGPYFGILLNPENAVNGFKDFDFGLNGILTGRYYLNPFMALLLGTQAQYGGLNNLLSSSSVDKLTTFNWGVFTGLSVGF